ncbi:MAG TPA: hypothetical protein PLD20_34725 [Blastocatellia bacterium]|nr:hypothetical protein [Blastocatellia bacterium]HMV85791.1 hypothetical protein [Blastocatellia bacterium]HMX29035.1 hypothetical protein [Blastocatellia bacterium]HMY72657.1 hypothetical protein [Blastocatellia bacterium]HMZ23131.1 hypothetical protein [Blastocatellia bacterium]
MPIVVDKWITVLERRQDVDTNILIQNNDWIDISVSGSIWAGVWFTGENGPQGWSGWGAGNDFPLPGSPPYSLLGKTAEDGYFFIGEGLRRTYMNATLGPGQTRLFLRINDNIPGNGSGAFNVRIQVWR